MKRALLALPLLALLTGCAGYRLGSPVPEVCRPIHVAAFENQTDYPMVGTLASQQLLDALIEDGTFTPTAYDNARLRVQAVIQPLDTDAVRYSRNDNLVPDEYHVALTARLYVFDAKTGKTYVNGKPITAVDSALTSTPPSPAKTTRPASKTPSPASPAASPNPSSPSSTPSTSPRSERSVERSR